MRFSPRLAAFSFALALALPFGCRKEAPKENVSVAPSRPASSGAGGGLPMTSGGASGGTVTSGGATAAGGEAGDNDEPVGGAAGDAGSEGGAAGSSGDGGSAPTEGPDCAPLVPATGPFSKRLLLEASADCAIQRYCEFAWHAGRLRDATATLASDANDVALEGAKAAWLAAMASWQRAEPFRFGPAARASSLDDPGGRDLRDLLYSWPQIGRCTIDEQLVSGFYATEEFHSTPVSSAITGRTLTALEYLLFHHAGTDNGCSDFSTINTQGTWDALEGEELFERKRDYALAVAEDVLLHANELLHAWSPDGDDFRSELVEAGASSGTYASEQAALNAVNQGLFYVEVELKDDKLGLPLGYSPSCAATRCPNSVESFFARVSTDHLRQNLRGFRRLFQGCGDDGAGVGFDDWLNEVGASDLALRMLAALDGAEAAVEALDPPLEDALFEAPERVEAVYAAVKALTDPLKTEFVTVLDLELPRASEGDND